MAKALESAVRLAGDAAIEVKKAIQDVLDRPTPFRDMQVLHGYQFGDGETVMHLHHADLLTGVGDARLFIGYAAALGRGHKVVAVPFVVAHLLSAAESQLQRFDGDEIGLAQSPGDLGRGDDGAGCPVADAAAVEQPQWVGDDGGGHHLVDGDGLSQMGLGIQGGVGVALGRDVGHGPLQVVVADAVLGPVGTGQLGKGARRGDVGHHLPGQRPGAGPPVWQPAVADVLEFFHAQG